MCIYIYVGEGVGPWASCFVICKDIVHMTRLLIKAVIVDELIFQVHARLWPAVSVYYVCSVVCQGYSA